MTDEMNGDHRDAVDGAQAEFVDRWRQNGFNCYSSGHKFCREVCPVTQVTRNENHTPTAFMANIIAMDKGGCEVRCPNTLFVGDFYQARTETVKVVKAARALMVDKGLDRGGWKLWNERTRELTNEPVLGVRDTGQPQGQPYVRDWAEGLDIPIGGETIMFVDCEAAFYRTANARATAMVLQKAGVEFGLMNEQWCCGGPAGEMGYVKQSMEFARHNIDDWRASGVKKIIAIEPHDYVHFTEDYPAYFGEEMDFEVVQIIELVADLIKEGRLKMEVPVNKTVTYHDPCRLNKRKNIQVHPQLDPGPDLQGRRPRDPVVLLFRRWRWPAHRKARDQQPDRREPAGSGQSTRRGDARQWLRLVGAAVGHGGQQGRHRGRRHHRARRRKRRPR